MPFFHLHLPERQIAVKPNPLRAYMQNPRPAETGPWFHSVLPGPKGQPRQQAFAATLQKGPGWELSKLFILWEVFGRRMNAWLSHLRLLCGLAQTSHFIPVITVCIGLYTVVGDLVKVLGKENTRDYIWEYGSWSREAALKLNKKLARPSPDVTILSSGGVSRNYFCST